MSELPKTAPMESTHNGRPPSVQYADSSAGLAARFAVLREPRHDDSRAEPARCDADASRYEFGETFARGGLGRIRRAYDRRLRRFVAVKELQGPRQGDSTEARFMREALITARLEHPSIVPIHDVGFHEDGEPYYCMKLVEGRSLEDIVRATPALTDRLGLLPHVLAVADALAYAHDRQVVHRDLKPSNVLVGPFGETVIIDWGLAKDLRSAPETPPEPDTSKTWQGSEGDESLTQTGELLGTLPFMPLEQAQGHDIGPQADVYAVGALLYFLLSSRPPYDGRNATVIYHQILAVPPPDIHQLVPDVSQDLAAIVRRAMARAPTDRYASARELAEDLRRFLAGRMVSARTYSPTDVLRYFVSRYRTFLGTVGVSLALLIALGIFSYLRIAHESAEAEFQRARAEDNLVLAEHKSVEAEQEAQRAKNTAFAALLASGRHLLFDQHQPQKALPILNEAYKLAPDDHRVKRLLGEATITADSLLHDFALPSAVKDLHFDPKSERLLAVDGAGGLHIWRLADGLSEAVPIELTTAVDDARLTDDGLVVLGRGEIAYYEDGLRRWRRLVTRDFIPHDLIPLKKHLVVREVEGYTVLDMANGNTVSVWRGKSPVYWTDNPIQPSNEHVFLLAFFRSEKPSINDRFTALRWDSENHNMDELIAGERHNLHSVAVSRDGRRVSYVVEDDDNEIRHLILDISAPDKPIHLDPCEEPEGTKIRDQDAVFSPDGTRIVRLINNQSLVRWNVETRRCVRRARLEGDSFNGIRASADGRTIVAQGRNGTIAVLDGETLALRRQFTASAVLLNSVVLSPDASALAVGDADGYVRVWNMRDPRIPPPYPLAGGPASLAGSSIFVRYEGERSFLEQIRWDTGGEPPTTKILSSELDNRRLASTDEFLLAFDDGGRATIWSLASGEELCVDMPLHHPYHTNSGVVSVSDEILLMQTDPAPGRPSDAWSSFETIDVKACRSESFRVHPPIHGSINALNHERVLVSSSSSQALRIIDTTTGALVAESPRTWGENWMFATPFPDGQQVVVSNGAGAAWVLDTHTGLTLARLNAPNLETGTWTSDRPAAFFTPDGATFITPSPSGALDVWDSETWEHRRTLHGHVRGMDDMVFSNDSTQALSFSWYGFGDANVFLWDLDVETPGIRLDVGRVSKASFDPRGEILATGTRDGIIHLWDTSTGEQVNRLEGDNSDIVRLQFSEDGQYLLGSSWYRVIMWKLPFETRGPEELDALIAARDLDASM